MGTWDVGPFDNDTAMIFCDALDEAAEDKREDIIRGSLIRAIDGHGDRDEEASEEAVAAAALVAAQCPAGRPVSSGYGPGQPLPEPSGDLRELAARALDRVQSEPSELMRLWGETDHIGPWRTNLSRLRDALLPQPPGEPPSCPIPGY